MKTIILGAFLLSTFSAFASADCMVTYKELDKNGRMTKYKMAGTVETYNGDIDYVYSNYNGSETVDYKITSVDNLDVITVEHLESGKTASSTTVEDEGVLTGSVKLNHGRLFSKVRTQFEITCK